MTNTTKSSKEATLTTIVSDAITNRLKNLHTCLPGIIQSFNSETGLAQIQPAIKRLLVTGEEIELPRLINCPIGIMRTANYSITFPVAKNDECMIHFTERSLDTWIKFGEVRKPNDLRMHAISDAYFIPAYTSQKQVVSEYDTNNLVMRSADNATKIVIDRTGIVTIDAVSAVLNADVTINGNVDINGDQTITGTSEATDHISNGKSGASHNHTGDSGGTTSAPL